MRLHFVAIALLSSWIWTVQAPAAAQEKAAPDPSVAHPDAAIARIVVIGADVSDGFKLEDEIGVPVSFADIVEAALMAKHEPVARKTSTLFAANPLASVREVVGEARTAKPTLLVGVDYVFWLGYGDAANDQDRLARLEQGLKLLDGFTCPVLLGDFPDASPALEAAPPFLQKSQAPGVAMLQKLNDFLHAWAAEHKNAIVVPVSDVVKKIHLAEEFRLRGNTYYKSAVKSLLQKDLLHPTADGSIALWIACADSLVEARHDVDSGQFDWNVQSIYRKLYASKERERQALLEEKRRKWEREHPAPPPPRPPPPGEKKERRDGGGG